MQRQKLTINFDLKSRTQATFTYKRGEIDKNGVEVELTNINVTNATGQVRIKDPEGNSLEPGIVTVNESKATFTLPTYLTGIWEFEVRIFNDNGTTISSTYSYSVLESLDTDDSGQVDHESAWDVWTKNEATRGSNESARTTAESTRVSNENTRISNEDKRQASITDIEKRFSSLTTAQQQQAEVVDARTDYNGVEHDTLKTRLDNDFETLASLIPTDIAFNGYESVTTNDTLSGEVSSTVLSGDTLVNAHTFPNYYDGTIAPVLITPKVTNVITMVVWYDVGELSVNYQLMGYLGNTHIYTYSIPLTGSGLEIRKIVVNWDTARYDNFRTRIHNVTSLGDTKKQRCIILEGDHTDKPLEFFEGLKSAEVSEVTSHGVNLVDVEKCEPNGKYLLQDGVTFYSGRQGDRKTTNYLNVLPNTTYFNVGNANNSVYLFEYSEKDVCINTDLTKYVLIKQNQSFTTKPNTKYVRMFTMADTIDVLDSLYLGTSSTYIPYQSKTTLSEPIILRSLPNGISDTYDVDTGVLTRRCGEVVLNGSESEWSVVSQSVETGFVKFKNLISTITTVTSSSKNDFAINDKFQHISLGEVMSNFGGNPFTTGSPTKEFFAKHNNATEIVISIAKSKLTTPDVAGFKAWLAQNPTTVVYQLAEPTTEYIENNGQLRSYDNQTTVSAESVVPVKLNGNIPVNYASTLNTLSTVARELKLENVALIEQAETLSEQLNIAEQTNNYQDSLIDVSLLATDELYTLIEPLLPEFATLETKGGNAMVDAYVAMVIKGLKTIDQVPARYREEVKRVLAELEK